MGAKTIVRPRALPKGGVIGVVAPASPVRREFLERGCEALQAHGYRIQLGASLFSRSRYTAGSVEQRLVDLRELWLDDRVDAIIGARGGYGSMELLEHLDPEPFAANPKIFMGASDLTALLCHLGANASMVSFHGPMVAQKIARGLDDSSQWLDLFTRKSAGHRIDWAGEQVLHSGTAEGRLWGGCLSILVSLVGTRYFPDLSESLLFVEDTGVKPYQIDRMLVQLRLAGHLDSVRGILFGQMLHCDQHPEQGYTISELLRELTEPLGVPVVFGLASGHTESTSRALPMGVLARMDERGLELLEGSVQ